ncbi:MAG: MmgE/PrpD family protein [Acidobacteriota bacterium]
MSSPTLAQQLAEMVAGVSAEALPAAVESSLRERILDTVGLCLAARPLPTSPMAHAVAQQWGGSPEARLIGWPERLPPAAAAFVNGVLAHSLDFDDTHLPSVLHPSAALVPAGLAVGEAVGATLPELLAALAGGYEVDIRTGMAAYDRELGNSVFFERGWHATSICGALGAAAVAARLFGLGADGIAHALGIACSMGAGIIEANRAGGSVKRLHCGWAAHAGVVAAQCARAGVTGPPTALEGRFGFYQAYCGGALVADEITAGLGRDWSIPGIFYKPYPANHFTHAGIDAARSLRGEIDPAAIERIDLGVASPTLRTIGEPRHEKLRPQSGYHGQFSGPFTVAAALLGGGGLGLWLDDFSDDKVRDRRYLEIADKVHCYANAECDAIFPNQFPAVLTVTTADGQVIERKVLANRGGPDNPLSIDELKTKFFANAGRLLDEATAQTLAASILDPSPRPVGELLAPLDDAVFREIAAEAPPTPSAIHS